MAKHKKPAPAAKKSAAKPAKPASKKVVKVPAKKPNQSSAKPAAAKPEPAPAKSAPAKPEAAAGKSRPPQPAPAAAGKSTPPMPAPEKPGAKGGAKANARELLRSRILGAKKSSKPIAFSLDEVREIAKTVVVKAPAEADKAAKPAAKSPTGKTDVTKLAKPAQPHHIKAASLADILGFNPKKAQKAVIDIDPENIPEKFRRYYKLLLELRTHLTEGITLHSEETLKRSAKDDAGDLSSYGQHMADAGTDTFDRDFALSLVSSEQEALTEIEAAIKRIHDGTYGVCEAKRH
jgi:RNA polymerase-binding transcription factor DksA